ncbi:hypothetical protein WAF17_09050 [Bernardetia sp. ABR2-2B]|uniref:COG3650 family protein n=1 Tax=Bernardetia sp. ABR2-2B TaxID=3127472 RepID=UPI0030CB0E1C
MKFIIPIFILFTCFSCNSPSKSHASTDDSVSTNTETNQMEKTETKDEPIEIGTDKVLFKSFGTEPFWSAEVRKSGILFSKYGLDSITFKYVEPKEAEGRLIESHHTYFLEDQDGKQSQLVVKKTQGCGCSDGMSDKEYEYHTFFLYDNQMFEGCGSSVTSEE